MADEPKPSEADEIRNEDFQAALRELLNAYQPILEEDLKRATAPEQLEQEAEQKPPSCDDELALANRIFEKFLTEEVAIRLLPPEARELMGPIDRWRWCLLHIRCCIIFGWLVGRSPRTFRAFVYYLYQYWVCVRQALGTPVSNPLTADERKDFQTLVQTLASAYKPYLTDQLDALESLDDLPDAVLAGKIDCDEGEDDSAAIFERLLTVETAPALLGRCHVRCTQQRALVLVLPLLVPLRASFRRLPGQGQKPARCVALSALLLSLPARLLSSPYMRRDRPARLCRRTANSGRRHPAGCRDSRHGYRRFL